MGGLLDLYGGAPYNKIMKTMTNGHLSFDVVEYASIDSRRIVGLGQSRTKSGAVRMARKYGVLATESDVVIVHLPEGRMNYEQWIVCRLKEAWV